MLPQLCCGSSGDAPAPRSCGFIAARLLAREPRGCSEAEVDTEVRAGEFQVGVDVVAAVLVLRVDLEVAVADDEFATRRSEAEQVEARVEVEVEVLDVVAAAVVGDAGDQR